MNKRDMENLNLQNAFPEMPQDCRDALLRAARSVKEEKNVKYVRFTFKTALIAALLIIAMTAVALAASGVLGWSDFLGAHFGEHVVPSTAVNAMNLEEKKSYEVGPLTFTVTQLMCDGHIAVSATDIRTTDGSPALLTSEPYDPIGAWGDVSAVVARRLGVDPDLTWIEAAKKLNLPLYNVRASLETDLAGSGMEDPLWDENNNISYFSMAYLELGKPEGTLKGELFLRVAPIDPETGEEVEAERAVRREKIEIPVSETLEEKVFRPETPFALQGMALNAVYAEHTVAGLYLTAEWTVDEGVQKACADENSRQDWLFEVNPDAENVGWHDETGQPYPIGMSLSGSLDVDQWPNVLIGDMISVETMPHTLTMICGEQEIVLKQENTK